MQARKPTYVLRLASQPTSQALHSEKHKCPRQAYEADSQ